MMKNINPSEALFCLGVKIILRNLENKILILKMEKNNKAFWELPGGKVQLGENEIQALYREMDEETGIKKIDNLKSIMMMLSKYYLTANDIENVGLIFSLFTGSVDSDTVVLSSDHIEYAWVDEQRAIDLLGDAYSMNFNEILKKIELNV